MSNIVKATIYADAIMEVFQEYGMASAEAYYQLLEDVERYIRKPDKAKLLYAVEFVFDFDTKRLNKALKQGEKEWKMHLKLNGIEDDPQKD